MELVLNWQKKLGYSKDPFEGNFSPAGRFLVGVSELQERLSLFLIKEERFGTIAGDRGSGKSLLLAWMNDELAPQKSHSQYLIDAKVEKYEEVVNRLLESRLSFVERFKKTALKLPAAEKEKELLRRLAQEQKTVLLVDNAGNLTKHELELYASIVAKTPTYILFTDTEDRLKKLSLPDVLIDKLKLKIPEYTNDQLIDLLGRRIQSTGVAGTYPFGDDELKSLIKKAEKNPAKLLSLAKERAIELSLKVKDLPKPAPAQVVKESGGGFLSIKVVKSSGSPAEDPIPAPVTAREALPPSETADAKMLGEILAQTEHGTHEKPAGKVTTIVKPEKTENIIVPARETKTEHKTKHDKVVERLAEEFAKPAKEPAKHTRKKKQ